MKQELAIDREREKRLMAMGQMAASLAHEIRNPLGSMELFCSLLKKDLHERPELLNLAEQIHSGIRTVNHIIANCLQFARDVVVNRHPVNDVAAFCEGALQQVRGKAEQFGVELECEAVGSGVIEVDQYQMKQVIINLVSNGIDAVAERFSQRLEEGEKPLVKLESDLSDPDEWVFRIVDNGVGITEEAKQKMFEPFYSTKTDGTGLGLAIVHSIIKAHQGNIVFESNDKPGCIVVVSMPRRV